ncbi:MAG: hypothetical protein E6713_04805 [Sporomusaceae bacterium]|nr:hypothetical protein [Sporomusaceae bacterium]
MGDELDSLIRDQIVPFHLRNVEALGAKHPHIMGMVNSVMANQENRAAIRIQEQGKIVGEYTFLLKGLKIETVESNTLDPQFQHPFLGKIKPFVTLERTVLEKVLADDKNYLEEPFSAVVPYLSEITIQFLP